ncbi:MAG: polyprenyl diphosphate synthase [Clostridia bacterium]
MRVPKHVAIIPDGNRRWATKENLKKHEGYDYGLDPGLEVLKLAKNYGIDEITYYGFTVDNCKRPKEQIDAFKKACVDAVEMIKKEGNVSLIVVGDRKSKCFPKELLKYEKREEIGIPEIKVNFLVNYGWQWDIQPIMQSEILTPIDAIHSKDISKIDLVIRWGGMRRLSGLLPLQSVYADFYIVEDMWPDFKTTHFDEAISWYNKQDITLGG